MQVRVPAVQVVMKTVEVPQVPFIDRREAIQSVPQELNSRCNTEEIKDVTVPSVVREVFEVVRHSTLAVFASNSWKSRQCVS